MYRLSDLQIELAGVCNAHCRYCTWQKRTVGKQLMDTNLAESLIDQAAKMDIPLVTFHGVGESCLHPELVPLLHLGDFCSLNMRLSTNCFNLKDGLASGLAKVSHLEMILAIPWVMPIKLVETCITNAERYLQSGPSNHTVTVQMVCDETAKPWYDRFIDTFLPYAQSHPNVCLYLKQPRTWPNSEPIKGFTPWNLTNQSKVRRDDIQTPISLGRGCNMPERFLMVLADGTCVPCCVGMDESWSLGKIQGRSLQEVWNSVEMENVRDLWRSASPKLPCGNCLSRSDA